MEGIASTQLLSYLPPCGNVDDVLPDLTGFFFFLKISLKSRFCESF